MDLGESSMSDSFDAGRKRSKRRSRRFGHRRKHRERDLAEERDDSDLTPEERVLRTAHENAERKTQLAGDVLWFLGVTLLLLIFIPPVAAIVFIVWGIKVGKQVYDLEIEPRLRERFVEQEVENQVAASLSGQRRVLEGEHRRSLEQLSAAIAHEIRNPITAAKSLVQQVGETPSAPENVEYARVALEELQRVERSVSHLLRFAREEEQGLTTVSMADITESALESFRDRAARAGITLDHRIDCEGSLRADAEQLRRVVINLLGNAMDALAQSDVRDPRIEVHMGENLAGTEVWLQVKDNGEGIDAEGLRKVFSPFYTSKEHGTGLGLAITKKLVEAHGGSIEATSEPGAGATFLLTFPKRIRPAGEAP
jgi:signal transduction histidine kinase